MEALARVFAPARRFAIPLNLDPVADALEKRLTPEQLASIQSELSVSAMRASTVLPGGAQSTSRPGANAATVSTTITAVAPTFSAAPSYTVGQPLSQTPSSSRSTTTTTTASSSSSSTTTTPASSSMSTLPQVITRTISSSSAASSLPTISSDAATTNNSSLGLSTGAVVGVVLAVLVGVVILGSMIGWLYRKLSNRGYESSSPWRKLEEDVTPFPAEKDQDQYGRDGGYHDDVYGGAAPAVIGSRRALADRADTYRPESEYMFERGSNRAGLGAGHLDAYNGGAVGSGGYPVHPTVYGVDAQGRPYNAQAGRVPSGPHVHHHLQQQQIQPHPAQMSPPGALGARQLAGPQLAPVPMGRPAAPQNYNDIASREDYGDEPLSAGLAYAQEEPYRPNRLQLHQAPAPVQLSPPRNHRISGTSAVGSPEKPSPPQPQPPLPSLAPLSPFSSSFDLNRQSQPLAMYAAEPERQKQLYGEVSHAAGIAEPITPHSATMSSQRSGTNTNPDDSFTSMTTTSSFSATEHGARLPPPPVPRINVNLPMPMIVPPQPYEHGRPLSPLTELPTPTSTINAPTPVPMSSSSIGPHYAGTHGGHGEVNPFDRLPLPLTPGAPGPLRNLTAQNGLAAPYSAASFTSGVPSPRYPPPSPGGMSVPGSVSDSPRRWSPGGNDAPAGMVRRSRGESMFGEEDAYGGI